jgi:hypothetical protein
MLTFKDLEFSDAFGGEAFGLRAYVAFPNGYGISVVIGPYTYGGPEGLYEAAVLDRNGSLTYDTPVTDDVIGHLTEEGVTDVMRQIQELSPAE